MSSENMESLGAKDLKDYLKVIKQLVVSMSSIKYGFRQIEIEEYYMTLESTKFIEGSVPDLKAKASTLKTSEYLALNDIEFIKSCVDYYEKFNKELQRNFEGVDKSKLVQLEKI